MTLGRETITICAVLAAVVKPGRAYGHTDEGQCTVLSGDKQPLIELFHRLRAFLKGEGPAVVVFADDWRDVHAIDRAACPNHMFPVAANPEDGISYYIPY